jgi:hypothetical protein
MIGAFAVGASAPGAGDSKIITRASFGIADSISDANGFNVGVGLLPANAFASKEVEGVPKRLTGLGVADAIAESLSFQSSIGSLPQIAGTTATAFSANIGLGISPVNVNASANDAQTGIPVRTNHMFGQYSFGSQAFGGASRIAIARAQLDKADTQTNAFGFNIGLGLGRANSSTTTNVFRQGVSLFLGRANAFTESFGLGQRQGANTLVADTTADAIDAQFRTFLDLGIGDSIVDANIIVPKYLLDLLSTNVDARAIDFSGVGLGTLVADVPADAIGMNLGIGLGRVNAPADGLDARWKVFLDLIPKDVRASATLIELLIALKVGLADSDARALSLADIVYVVDDVPIISVDRIPTEATVIVENQNDFNVNIYRADDHRGKVALHVADHDDAVDYIDESLESSVNYKYVVAFVSSGTKGGQPYIEVGERSLPVYTQGNKIL